MEYYVFSSEQTALDAESYITQVAGYPVAGVRASDGQPRPDAQKTERYAIPIERLDGKWVFPRIPQSIRDQYPQSVKDNFNNSYPHTIEVYNPNWFPSDE